jgi:hypothetical protein
MHGSPYEGHVYIKSVNYIYHIDKQETPLPETKLTFLLSSPTKCSAINEAPVNV